MLRPRWRKVLNDLWDNKARSLLVVVSIAVGVFAVGAVAGAYTIIPRDMNASYAGSNPANIELVCDAFEQDFVKAIGRLDGVAQVEGRRTFSVRMRDRSGAWASLTLMAVEDFSELGINRLLPDRGADAPPNRQMLLLNKSAETYGIEVGDRLEIELPDGTLRHVPVAGIVKDLTAGTGGYLREGIGYVTRDTLDWLRQPAGLNRLYVITDHPNDADSIQDVLARVEERVERSGRTVYSSQWREQDRHPLASIILALLGVLGSMGLLLILLSGSLIANTLSSLLSQHVRQIGVMKLVGARRRQIVGMYLTLITVFGLLALLLAVPPAGWVAYALSQFVADLINFQLRPAPAVPLIPLAIGLQTAMALVVPLLTGLAPVLMGSRVTVQKAITSTGLSGERGGRGWLDRRLERLRRFPRPVRISIRNAFRRKGRLALTLFTLTLGGAIFVAVFNVQVALNATASRSARYFQADVNLDMAQPYSVAQVSRLAMAVPGVRRVEAWGSARAELLRADKSVVDAVTILAPPADSVLVDPALLAGRWLLPGDRNVLAVNEAFLAVYPDLQPGDVLRLRIGGEESEWSVAGVFQYTGGSALAAYANYEYLARKLDQPRQAALFRIVGEDHSLIAQQRLSAQIDSHFSARGFRVAKAEAGKSLVETVTDLLRMLVMVLLLLALLTALVGSIGLAGTLGMNVMERTREIGVMRAIGAHNQIVMQLVVAEGLLMGLISFVLGALLSFPITALLSNIISLAIFHVPAGFAITWQGFAIWSGVVVALTLLASVVPARNASRLTIREVLAYE